MRGFRQGRAVALSMGMLAASLFGNLGRQLPYFPKSQARAESTMSPWLLKQRTSHRYATGGGYHDQRAKDRATARLNRAVRRLDRLKAAGHDVDASHIASHIKRNARLARAA